VKVVRGICLYLLTCAGLNPLYYMFCIMGTIPLHNAMLFSLDAVTMLLDRQFQLNAVAK
jgi:hypothetical protein